MVELSSWILVDKVLVLQQERYSCILVASEYDASNVYNGEVYTPDICERVATSQGRRGARYVVG